MGTFTFKKRKLPPIACFDKSALPPLPGIVLSTEKSELQRMIDQSVRDVLPSLIEDFVSKALDELEDQEMKDEGDGEKSLETENAVSDGGADPDGDADSDGGADTGSDADLDGGADTDGDADLGSEESEKIEKGEQKEKENGVAC